MSLDSLVSAASGDELKFVFVGGKGGVGKTTTSSAIATLLAATCQKRVLLISTDPAHSLGDAWRNHSFSNIPTPIQLRTEEGLGDGSGSLDIMEVDPQQSMNKELQEWSKVSQELFNNNTSSSSSSSSSQEEEWSTKIYQFQQWLSGIPGIDEATALSTAITHIESGQYDIIVFDTAPTGHTLKLLALPDILEQGIDKLQSWQSTFWGYWETFKAVGSSLSSGSSRPASKQQKRMQLKDHVRDKLIQYKQDIQKVSLMLQDQTRTRFVVVCIAEYLSISETQRLLQELSKNKVVASHIVVNQLVIQDALSSEELLELEGLAEVGNLQLSSQLLQKTVQSCRLTTARKNIQQRYLAQLKQYPETQSMLNGICEVPLLAEEVTGPQAIQRFANLLINKNLAILTERSNRSSTTASTVGPSNDRGSGDGSGKLYDDLIAQKNATGTAVAVAANKADDDATSPTAVSYAPGDIVQVVGLAKSPQFNDLKGTVTTAKNEDTGRYGVTILYQGKSKTLALQPKNLRIISKSSVDVDQVNTKTNDGNAGINDRNDKNDTDKNPLVDKAKRLLDDPEIKVMIETNPNLKVAVEDCLQNPMNVMKYLGNPDLSPFISKIMSKL